MRCSINQYSLYICNGAIPMKGLGGEWWICNTICNTIYNTRCLSRYLSSKELCRRSAQMWLLTWSQIIRDSPSGTAKRSLCMWTSCVTLPLSCLLSSLGLIIIIRVIGVCRNIKNCSTIMSLFVRPPLNKIKHIALRLAYKQAQLAVDLTQFVCWNELPVCKNTQLLGFLCFFFFKDGDVGPHYVSSIGMGRKSWLNMGCDHGSCAEDREKPWHTIGRLISCFFLFLFLFFFFFFLFLLLLLLLLFLLLLLLLKRYSSLWTLVSRIIFLYSRRSRLHCFPRNLLFMVLWCQPNAHLLTWRTRVLLFVWNVTLDSFGLGDAGSSYATAGRHRSWQHCITQVPPLQGEDTLAGSGLLTEI
jgi:hypothetical protein